MSFVETSDEFSDKVAKMTASILQEQLAPILETLREHARLLDLHSALLNHSTAMNSYNVGKIDDIRDFQNNINFKLKFHVDPEDRRYPRTPSASTSTGSPLSAGSPLPAAPDAHAQPDEPTHSAAASSSSVAASPGLPDRPSTPAATEHADSRPTTPRQQLGDGFSVVPGPSRLLQRERPFSVAPDPMWNSSREIRPYEPLATHAPPPYDSELPPTYVEVVRHSEPDSVETIEIEPSTLQSSTLDVEEVSVSSRNIPRVPVAEGTQNNPSHRFGPSWTFASSTSDQLPIATGDEPAHQHPGIESEVTASAGDAAHDDPSHLPNVLTSLPEEAGDVGGGSGDENPDVEPQLSEKARGKKRMREEDYPSDEQDDSETLEILLGEGSSSAYNPGGSCGASNDLEQPDRKRMKIDADTDRTVDDGMAEDEPDSCLGLVQKSSWIQAKKLKEIEKRYRRTRLLA